MYPSVKTIETRLNVSNETAKTIRKLMDGRLVPEEVSEPTKKWVQSCYNEPSEVEKIMSAIDFVLETYGCEVIFIDGYPAMEYCNTGDTYAMTVMYDYKVNRFRIMSWGDWWEKFGEKFRDDNDY